MILSTLIRNARLRSNRLWLVRNGLFNNTLKETPDDSAEFLTDCSLLEQHRRRVIMKAVRSAIGARKYYEYYRAFIRSGFQAAEEVRLREAAARSHRTSPQE